MRFIAAGETMDGLRDQRRGEAPTAGSRVEIVKCFDRCKRKETRSRDGRPHPGSEIGKVESKVWVQSAFEER